MIKLIATDIDGTLVKDSSKEVYPELIAEIKRLRAKGIIFVVASGRQYYSIRAMFEEVADDIVYICENGAQIVYKGENLHIKEMLPLQVEGIVGDMRKYRGLCEILISTPDGCYMETKNPSFVDLIENSYRNKYTLVDDVLQENLTVIKASLFQKGSIRQEAESDLIPKWSDTVKACMAGDEWVDFMDASVDKGNAIRFLQDFFGVTKEETMAFGDNNNDVGMIMSAGESYAVENAVEEVKNEAKYICPSYEKKGVYQVLKNIS